MKLFDSRSFGCCLVASLTSLVLAGQNPVRNLQVTLRGKKYDVDDDVTTVKELTDRLKEVSGVSSPHSVLFGGKRLEATDVLSDVGVADGAQLNMVPSTTSTTKSKTKSSSSNNSKTKSKKAAATTATGDKAAAGAGAEASADAMRDYLKGAGVDTDKLEEMVKGMGGGGAGGAPGAGGMPDMKESMEMMSGMMNSPIFKEYMNDPEKLEQSRQMILNNPMLKSMMAGMPGMEDLLNSPEAWREAMQAASNLYQNMDQDQLMNMMQQGGGAGMPPGAGGGGSGAAAAFGLDGTLDQSATTKALDELEEDD